MAIEDDIFAQNEQIIALLNSIGFVRERVSNETLHAQNVLILNELRTIKSKLIKTGGRDGA